MLRWVLWAWWNLMIISNEGMDFNDPKEFDDHQLFDDPSYSMIPAILWSQLLYDPSYSMIPAILWSPAIRWSQAIQLSPAIQWSVGSMDFDNPKAYGDTFISNGLFNNVAGSNASMKVAIFTIQTCSISCMKCQSALQSIITEVFITCKSDNEILKQSSSFEQSQLF